ncbi:MAG: insulinase family protein [Myxococcota bacterium]
MEVFALADQHFAAIPKQPAPAPVTTTEPPQQGERRIRLERPAQTAMIQLAYHIPKADDADTPALELLMTILSGGDSSRLHQALVEEQQVSISTGGFLDGGFDPGLAWFYAVIPPGGDPAKVEKALDDQIDSVVKSGVTQAELDKARNIEVAGFYRTIATISGKAGALGEFEVFYGDWRKLFSATEDFEKVTVEDIQRVATQYLKKSNRTLGLLVPTEGGAQ